MSDDITPERIDAVYSDSAMLLSDLLNSIIPDGWVFHTCDASTKLVTVTLKRDKNGVEWWHSLPEQDREIIFLYVSGSGKTFGDAVIDAAASVRDNCV